MSQEALAKAFMGTDDDLRTRMGHHFGPGNHGIEEGSGTTCVAGGLRRQADGRFLVYLANAGDSRGMILRQTNRKNASQSLSNGPSDAAEANGASGGDEMEM